MKKFSSGLLKGKKRGFVPNLIIGGTCPGCPPKSLRLCLVR